VGNVNRLWHQQHVLGKGASLEERMAWHSEHQLVCACRAIPAKLLAQMSVSGASTSARKNAMSSQAASSTSARSKVTPSKARLAAKR